MTRFVQRWIASAVSSISIVAATVGASYGQQERVRVEKRQYDESVIAAPQQAGDTSLTLELISQQIRISDVARRPGS